MKGSGMWRNIMLQGPGKARKVIILASSILTVAMVFFYLFKPAFIEFLDNRFYDTMLRERPEQIRDKARAPLVVDLDERSLSEYGQWPWPRYRLARLLEKIEGLGASSIGLDMIFAEPDRTSLAVIRRDIYRELDFTVPMNGVPESFMDNDKALSQVLSRGPFVLAYKFSFSASQSPLHAGCLLNPINVAVTGGKGGVKDTLFLYQGQGAVCNIGVLARAVSCSGFLNIIPDTDGVIRRVPLVIGYHNEFFPSLALAALTRALEIKQFTLHVDRGGIESLRFGGKVVPLDARGNLLIRYRGKSRTLDSVSAADVLSGAVGSNRVKGRIVFVGASAVGLADLHPTPVDTVLPGVEVHATIVENILSGDFFFRPNWAPALEVLLILGAGFFCTLLLTWTGALWSLAFLCLGAIGLWHSSSWILHGSGAFLSPVVPLITLGADFSLITLLKFWREERKAKLRSRELTLTQDFTIRCLASLTEARDSETGGHILRTQRYVAALCAALSHNHAFAGLLDSETLENLYKSAPLHDIGKVGVSDHILHKPGKLTAEEFEEMKKHTSYGRDAIQRAEKKFGTGTNSSFLDLAKEMAYTHHEKWDGTGYPEHLMGEDIPLSGRVMAIADVYDALVSQRVYKPPFSHEEAVAMITQLKGVFFDPSVVDAFVAVEGEFKGIAIEFADADEHDASNMSPPVTQPR